MGRSFAWLGVAYPLLAHAAVAAGSAPLTLAAVAVLALLVLGPGLLRGSRVAWLALLPVAAGLAWLHRVDAAALVLYAPPVVFTLALAWLFGHTLLRGRVPLIERLVRLLHPPGERLDPAIPPYARRLTLAWTVLLLALAATNLALALLATPGGLLLAAGIEPPLAVPVEAWSAFANLLNYAIVAAFFVGEYAWRRRRFPQQPYAGFVDFCRRAAAVGPRVFGRDAARAAEAARPETARVESTRAEAGRAEAAQ